MAPRTAAPLHVSFFTLGGDSSLENFGVSPTTTLGDIQRDLCGAFRKPYPQTSATLVPADGVRPIWKDFHELPFATCADGTEFKVMFDGGGIVLLGSLSRSLFWGEAVANGFGPSSIPVWGGSDSKAGGRRACSCPLLLQELTTQMQKFDAEDRVAKNKISFSLPSGENVRLFVKHVTYEHALRRVLPSWPSPPVLTRADGTVAGLSEYVDGDEELILSF